MRHKRKLHHLALALHQQGLNDKRDFSQLQLIHDCLTEVSPSEVDLSTEFLGKTISSPIIINAITGGSKKSTNLNIKLAQLSKEFNIPMAVGSQTIAIKDKKYLDGFKIVRRINKKGFLIANVSALVDLDSAKRAIEMIEADALQLHLNPAQELIMPEGDKKFKGILKNISKIRENIDVPIIVKEVGCGISYNAAKKLKEIGINVLDTGGYGGTNFMKIEGQRGNFNPIDPELYRWGITTINSILQLRKITGIKIIAGGGIKYPNQVVKALALGSDYISMAYFFLKAATEKNQTELHNYFAKFLSEIKLYMALQGVQNIKQQKNAKILKNTDWLTDI